MQLYFRYPLFTLLLIITLYSIAPAQAGKKDKTDWPVITLRSNPLSILERDANIMLGAGFQWNPRWAISFEPAYIFYRLYEIRAGSNGNDRVSGLKLRTDIRYYVNDYEFGKKAVFFMGAEFHYKYVATSKWDDFGINCVNGQCDFYQRAMYKEIKNETGGLLKIGINTRAFGDRVGLEFYGGLGAKFKDIRQTALPAGGSFVNEPSDAGTNFFPGEGWMIMLPAGIKCSFRIR